MIAYEWSASVYVMRFAPTGEMFFSPILVNHGPTQSSSPILQEKTMEALPSRTRLTSSIRLDMEFTIRDMDQRTTNYMERLGQISSMYLTRDTHV